MRHHTIEGTESKTGETVTLKGGVQKRRDLGGLIFIDLRDRKGIIQGVFKPEDSKEALETAEKIRSEYVIEVSGEVLNRDPSQVHENIATGKIDVLAGEVTVLSKSETPPFQIPDDSLGEDVRLKYRYLDLRRNKLQNTLRLRHQINRSVRNFL